MNKFKQFSKRYDLFYLAGIAAIFAIIWDNECARMWHSIIATWLVVAMVYLGEIK